MKLKYSFETVDMGTEIVAVPVGENADKVHGVLKVNKEGKEILNLLKEEITKDEIIDFFSQRYDNSRSCLNKYVSDFLEILSDRGIVE